MNSHADNPFRSPEMTSEVSDSPVPRKYPWSIIRAQLACVALALAQFGESYVNRYDVDGIHEMMLYGGVATLAAGVILAIPDWRTMALPFLYFTVVTVISLSISLRAGEPHDLTSTFHSGWLQVLFCLTILFQTGSASARRYYLRGHADPFASAKSMADQETPSETRGYPRCVLVAQACGLLLALLQLGESWTNWGPSTRFSVLMLIAGSLSLAGAALMSIPRPSVRLGAQFYFLLNGMMMFLQYLYAWGDDEPLNTYHVKVLQVFLCAVIGHVTYRSAARKYYDRTQ